MKNAYRFFLDAGIITAYVLLFCWLLGAFSGFPKGVDAYTHATKIRFILENWPHINWFPYSFSGYAIFTSYPSLAYYLYALFVTILKSSIESSMIFFTALSFSLTGVGLYGFIHKVTNNRVSAIMTPIILISTPAFLGPTLTGGAYTRSISTMFFSLALWSAISYIKNLEDGKRTKKLYFITIFLMTFSFASNILIGFVAALTLLLLFLFCINGWKKRLFHVFKVFFPAALLSVFFYVPYSIYFFERTLSLDPVVRTFYTQYYTAPWPIEFIVASLGMSTLIWLSAEIVVKLRKIEFEFYPSRVLMALNALVLFFFLYSATDLPAWLRFFSTYDGDDYISLYLAIVNGILLGGILTKLGYPSVKRNLHATPSFLSANLIRRRRILISVALLMIALFPLSYYSFVKDNLPVIDKAAEDWAWGEYSAKQLMKSVQLNEAGFRLTSEWPDVQGWLNYEYDIQQTGDRFPLGAPYPTWNYWFTNEIWKSNNNWQETKFFLDWYGVRWLIASNYDQRLSIEKFLSRPKYFRTLSSIVTANWSQWGTVYLFEYEHATPILSPTNATTLLVIGQGIYDTFFRSLAYSNYNGQNIIPIRGEMHVDDYSTEELATFNIVYIALYADYFRSFDNTWLLLKQYVESGGILIIDTGHMNINFIPLPSPVARVAESNFKEWNFTYINSQMTSWTNFTHFEPPTSFSYSFDEEVRPWAETILRSHNYPLVVNGDYGKGRVVWAGLNFPYDIVARNDSSMSLFFTRLIESVSGTPEKVSSTSASISLDDIGIVNATEPFEQIVKKYNYTVIRSNPEQVRIKIDNVAKGVLFKESYARNWHAHFIDNNGTRKDLNIYRAGPDFMYVVLPKSSKFLGEVIFEYGISEVQQFSYIISLSTLVFLTMYGIGLPVDRPIIYTLEKIRSIKLRPFKRKGEP